MQRFGLILEKHQANNQLFCASLFFGSLCPQNKTTVKADREEQVNQWSRQISTTSASFPGTLILLKMQAPSLGEGKAPTKDMK